MAQYTLPHIQTPLFITNDLADSWQFGNILKLGCDPRTDGCNVTQRAAIVEYRQAMLNALQPLASMPGSGAFLPSCYQHCEQVCFS